MKRRLRDEPHRDEARPRAKLSWSWKCSTTLLPDLLIRACPSFRGERDHRHRHLDAVAHRDVRRGSPCLHQERPKLPDAVGRTECLSRQDADAVRRELSDADAGDPDHPGRSAAGCCALSADAEPAGPAADAELPVALRRRLGAVRRRDPAVKSRQSRHRLQSAVPLQFQLEAVRRGALVPALLLVC